MVNNNFSNKFTYFYFEKDIKTTEFSKDLTHLGNWYKYPDKFKSPFLKNSGFKFLKLNKNVYPSQITMDIHKLSNWFYNPEIFESPFNNNIKKSNQIKEMNQINVVDFNSLEAEDNIEIVNNDDILLSDKNFILQLNVHKQNTRIGYDIKNKTYFINFIKDNYRNILDFKNLSNFKDFYKYNSKVNQFKFYHKNNIFRVTDINPEKSKIKVNDILNKLLDCHTNNFKCLPYNKDEEFITNKEIVNYIKENTNLNKFQFIYYCSDKICIFGYDENSCDKKIKLLFKFEKQLNKNININNFNKTIKFLNEMYSFQEEIEMSTDLGYNLPLNMFLIYSYNDTNYLHNIKYDSNNQLLLIDKNQLKNIYPIIRIKDQLFNSETNLYEDTISCFTLKDKISDSRYNIFKFDSQKKWNNIEKEINTSFDYINSLRIWDIQQVFMAFYSAPIPSNEIAILYKRQYKTKREIICHYESNLFGNYVGPTIQKLDLVFGNLFNLVEYDDRILYKKLYDIMYNFKYFMDFMIWLLKLDNDILTIKDILLIDNKTRGSVIFTNRIINNNLIYDINDLTVGKDYLNSINFEKSIDLNEIEFNINRFKY